MSDLASFLKFLRLRNVEKASAMAEKLGISGTLLSLIENQRRNVPKYFFERVVSNYDLNREERNKLKELCLYSNVRNVRLRRRDTLKKAYKVLMLMEDIRENIDIICTEIVTKEENVNHLLLKEVSEKMQSGGFIGDEDLIDDFDRFIKSLAIESL